ncbi:MAG: hypothetical protein N2512_09145 [Armatimonadetes bacterium]|nr:hypothetical protein [Armatimonadota bacterium]
MASQPPILRPLSIAEILDTAFRLWQRNFGTLVSIAAVVYVPLAVVQVVLVALVAGVSAGAAAAGPAGMPVLGKGMAAGAIGGALLIAAVGAIGVALVYAALAVAVSRYYLGRPVTVGDAYACVVPRLGPLLATWFLVFLAVAVGTLLCVIPGIYLGVVFAFAWPLVVLENRGPSDAMSRSQQLVSGYWGRVFLTMLLLSLIVVVIQWAVATPANLLGQSVLGKGILGLAFTQLVGAAAQMVLLPLSVTGLIVLYYDLRVRKEAFDLQLLATEIGPKVGVPAPAAVPGKPPSAPPAEGPPTEGLPTVPPGVSEELPPAPGAEEGLPLVEPPTEEAEPPTEEDETGQQGPVF